MHERRLVTIVRKFKVYLAAPVIVDLMPSQDFPLHREEPKTMKRRTWMNSVGLSAAAGSLGAVAQAVAADPPQTHPQPDAETADLQRAKDLVRAHYEAIATATPETIAAVLEMRTSRNWLWRGMHPFHEKKGAADVAKDFWVPFLTAMRPVQRRPDIFLAGRNEIDKFSSTWVVCMGHLMGLFTRPWLGIRPTGRIAMLRFAEFNRVEDKKIVETAFFFDIPHFMIQAGQNPFPPQTAAHLVQPGPATHDGLMHTPQDAATGVRTLAVINAMMKDMGDDKAAPHDRHARSWHEDMIWWGPAGIGATYTIDGYMKQHTGPFNAALSDGYKFNGHLCRLAEGHFGGFFGWPNLTVTNSGGYLGMTASPKPADMRVVDLYREAEGKLAENWIFIDLLHYLNMQGLDVLSRMASLGPG